MTLDTSPVRTAFAKPGHDRKEKTRVQSPHLSFNHWKRPRDVAYSKETDDICSRGSDRRAFFYSRRKGTAERCVGGRERSDPGHFERSRFFWRRRSGWT